MIEKMTKYSFILLDAGKEDFLSKLQDLGLVDVTRSTKAMDDTARQMVADIELIGGLIQGLKKVTIPAGTPVEHIDGDIVRLAGGMIMRYSDDTAEIQSLHKELETRRIWGTFDPEILQKLSEAGVPVTFHKLPTKQFKPEWNEQYAISVVNQNKSGTWFVVAGEDPLPGKIPTPETDASQLEQTLKEKEQHFQKVLSRIAGAKERIPELEQKKAGLCSKLDLYLAEAASVPAAENTIATLVGYAPVEDDAAICAALDSADVFYMKEDAVLEDDPPIKLRNNWFTRQFEVLTTMYGFPVYNEFDPTPILGPFFLLFFAMCMGDAGYGLLLILIGWLLKKKAPSMADLSPLVIMLGCSTFIIGIILHSFFGINIYEAAWVPDFLKKIMISGTVAGYDAQMVLAIGVGIFHICLAMVVKALCYTRRDGFLNTLGTWGWTLLIVGGVIVAGFSLAGIIDKSLTKIIVIVLGSISAIGIFLLNDIHRNPLVNIGSGLWATYNTATGLLGDTLSYLRLFALGMAGGMLGNTFNMLGGMILDSNIPILNWVFFIVIILIGHALNLALSCLGAFVHPLRLTFVEYFKNSGYEGAGREYKPLKK